MVYTHSFLKIAVYGFNFILQLTEEIAELSAMFPTKSESELEEALSSDRSLQEAVEQLLTSENSACGVSSETESPSVASQNGKLTTIEIESKNC